MPAPTASPDATQLERTVRVLAWVARRLEGSCEGLTLAQYRVLRIIAGGGDRASEISAKLAVAKPTITAVVDGLVTAGHLTRHTVDGDRRATRLELTDAGLAALATAEASMAASLTEVLGRLDDPAPFLTACAELADALEAR